MIPKESKRLAEDRRDCYWLYVVTNCKAESKLETPVKDPARFNWQEITKVEHYRLDVDSLTELMQGRNPLSAPESADDSQEGGVAPCL